MKYLFFFLLLPLFSVGQTIHFKKKEIIYKGTVALAGLSAGEITARLQKAVDAMDEKIRGSIQAESSKNKTVFMGKMELSSPFQLIRTLNYTLQATASSGGYDYKIDSVSVTEQRRGGKAKQKSAEDLLENMEETGMVAIENEKLLNEIDLRLQKLLTLLQKGTEKQ